MRHIKIAPYALIGYMSRPMYSARKKHGPNQEKTPIFTPRSYILSLGIEALLFCTLLLNINYRNEDRR